MNNKKIGGSLVILGLSLLLILFSYNSKINSSSNSIGCNPSPQCQKNNSLLTISNIFIGIISSLTSLGIYILFFSEDKELLNRINTIEYDKKELREEEKFEFLLKALSKDEQDILRFIKAQEGITQSTLRIKTGMSKTKLSFVLSDLEKKELIKKEIAGKTNQLYLKAGILSFSKHITN